MKFVIEEGIVPSFREASRPRLWTEYSKRIIRQPFGLGVNYALVTYGDDERGPHNTILEILTLGGVLSLAGFIYLFYLGFKNIIMRLREVSADTWTLYLITALTGLVIASFFDNMSTFRIMWVLLGLALFVPQPAEEQILPDTTARTP